MFTATAASPDVAGTHSIMEIFTYEYVLRSGLGVTDVGDWILALLTDPDKRYRSAGKQAVLPASARRPSGLLCLPTEISLQLKP